MAAMLNTFDWVDKSAEEVAAIIVSKYEEGAKARLEKKAEGEWYNPMTWVNRAGQAFGNGASESIRNTISQVPSQLSHIGRELGNFSGMNPDQTSQSPGWDAARWGLIGAGAGGVAGLGSGLMSRRRRPISRMLTGALLGGTLGAFGGGAWGAHRASRSRPELDPAGQTRLSALFAPNPEQAARLTTLARERHGAQWDAMSELERRQAVHAIANEEGQERHPLAENLRDGFRIPGTETTVGLREPGYLLGRTLERYGQGWQSSPYTTAVGTAAAADLAHSGLRRYGINQGRYLLNAPLSGDNGLEAAIRSRIGATEGAGARPEATALLQRLQDTRNTPAPRRGFIRNFLGGRVEAGNVGEANQLVRQGLPAVPGPDGHSGVSSSQMRSIVRQLRPPINLGTVGRMVPRAVGYGALLSAPSFLQSRGEQEIAADEAANTARRLNLSQEQERGLQGEGLSPLDPEAVWQMIYRRGSLGGSDYNSLWNDVAQYVRHHLKRQGQGADPSSDQVRSLTSNILRSLATGATRYNDDRGQRLRLEPQHQPAPTNGPIEY